MVALKTFFKPIIIKLWPFLLLEQSLAYNTTLQTHFLPSGALLWPDVQYFSFLYYTPCNQEMWRGPDIDLSVGQDTRTPQIRVSIGIH